MKNTKKRGFKVFMALIGLVSIYGALFFYGCHANITAPKVAKKTTKSSKSKKDNGLTKYQSYILGAARKHKVPPALIAAIMHAESGFNPRAISPVGARGLMQINGITQRHLGVRNVFDPRENINGGARYLRELLSTFRGNTRMAVAAYNAGPGAVRKFRGIPPYKETRRYVGKVLKLYSTYKRMLPHRLMLSQSKALNNSTS